MIEAFVIERNAHVIPRSCRCGISPVGVHFGPTDRGSTKAKSMPPKKVKPVPLPVKPIPLPDYDSKLHYHYSMSEYERESRAGDAKLAELRKKERQIKAMEKEKAKRA